MTSLMDDQDLNMKSLGLEMRLKRKRELIAELATLNQEIETKYDLIVSEMGRKGIPFSQLQLAVGADLLSEISGAGDDDDDERPGNHLVQEFAKGQNLNSPATIAKARRWAGF